jgi:hypothetical protein
VPLVTRSAKAMIAARKVAVGDGRADADAAGVDGGRDSLVADRGGGRQAAATAVARRAAVTDTPKRIDR